MNTATYNQAFEQQGYLVVEDLLSPQEVSRSCQEIERLHDVARTIKDPDNINFQIEPYAQGSSQNAQPVLRKIEHTRDVSPWFKDLAQHSKLIEVVQSLLGPDLLLFRSTLMLKPAFHGSTHAFHQDTSYWPLRPPRLVTVSIAISDATEENGCFQVLPNSHRWPTETSEYWGRIAREQQEGLTDRQDIDASQAIYVPLRAGSALFFHSAIVHGSGPNKSPNPRHTALYAYFSPDVKYVASRGPREKTFPVVAGMDGQKEMTFVAEKV